MLSLVLEGTLARVGVIFNRKLRRRPQDREAHSGLFSCVGSYPVAVLMLFGWKCHSSWALAGVVSPPFQPDSVCLRVLRQCLLIERARSQPLRSPTFSNGLVSMRRVHSLTHQRIKTRNFHLI